MSLKFIFSKIYSLFRHIFRFIISIFLHPAKTQTLRAIGACDLIKLASLHEKYKDLNFKLNGYKNILLYAAQYSNVQIVKYIINEIRSISLDECNNYGDNALLVAGFYNKSQIIEYLLFEKRMDIKFTDYRGNNLLIVLAANGRLEIIKKLVAQIPKLNLNTRNFDGQTALHRAARYNHVDVVLFLLGRPEVNPCPKDYRGDTPLHLAAKHFNAGLIRAVLRSTAQLKDSNCLESKNTFNETPLSILQNHMNSYAKKYLDSDKEILEEDAMNYLLHDDIPKCFNEGIFAVK